MAKKYVTNPINLKLYYMAKICHLYPLNFDFRRRRKFKLGHYFSIILSIVVISSISAWNYLNKYSFVYRHVDVSYSVMEVMTNVLLTLFNISCIIIAQKSSNQWEILFKPLFNNVKYRKYVKSDYMFYLVHLIQLIWVLSEVYLCWSHNFNMFSPIFLTVIDKINIYMVQISVLLINGYIGCMKETISSIKVRFQHEIALITKLKGIERNSLAVLEKYFSDNDIDDILNFFVEASKGIDAFNSIYGVQILGLSGIIMILITNMCNSVIVFMGNMAFFQGLLGLKIYCAVSLLVCGALVVSPCFETTKKFDEVVKVTCKLLIELPHGLEDSHHRILKEKLVLLIKQLEFRKPYFSAAGFYEVNYNMFLYIFGGVTSFVVVYLQLQHKI